MFAQGKDEHGLYGARGVKKAVEKLVAVPLTKLLLFIATGAGGGEEGAAGEKEPSDVDDGVVSRAGAILNSNGGRQELLRAAATGGSLTFSLESVAKARFEGVTGAQHEHELEIHARRVPAAMVPRGRL